ncbi:MAG: hypothetical protein V1678_01410 [Candidatus Aenigmatarchaeota archaeon]
MLCLFSVHMLLRSASKFIEKKPIEVETIRERIRNEYIKNVVPKAIEELTKFKMIECNQKDGSYKIAKDYECFFEKANESIEKFDSMVRNNQLKRNAKMQCERLGIPYKEEHPGLDLLVETGRRQIEEAKKKYGKDWKEVPLREIFEN